LSTIDLDRLDLAFAVEIGCASASGMKTIDASYSDMPISKIAGDLV
jgi:hypothetical protein